MNKLKEIQFYNRTIPGKLSDNLLFYFPFDTGTSIVNSISGKLSTNGVPLFSGQILPTVGNFWINSGRGYINNNYIKINNTNNLINFQDFTFICVYDNISKTGATLLSTVSKSLVEYFDEFGNLFNDFVFAGFEFGFTANNRLFFEFYGANGPKVFTSDFDLADKSSVFLSVSNRNATFGYYNFAQDNIVSNNFNFNSEFIFNPTGLFIGKNPGSSNLYNYNKQFEGYIEQMILCSPTIYQYEIENINKAFVSNYIPSGSFYNETLLTGITGFTTGALGEEIALTGFLFGVTGFTTGILGIDTGVVTGVEFIETGTYEDEFGNIEIGYEEVQLFGDVVITGSIPLTGVLRLIESGIINEGISGSNQKISEFGKNNINLLSKIDNEDFIEIQSITGNYDKRLFKNINSFYDNVSKNYIFRDIKSASSNTKYALFANGLLTTSGSGIQAGNVYSPSIFISGGDYIETRRGDFLFSNFDDTHSIFGDLITGDVISNDFNLSSFNYVEKQKIIGSNQNNYYGDSVAVNSDGSIILMGGRSDDEGGISAGAVIVYTGNSTIGWTQKQKLIGDSQNDLFGMSSIISHDGSVIVMGGYWDEPDPFNPEELEDAGAAMIFTGNMANGWTFKQKITGDSGGDLYGDHLAMSSNGSVIIIGGVSDDEGAINAGAALVYTGDALNSWKLKQKLTGDRGINDFYGVVATNNDASIIVMGGYGDDVNSVLNVGSALIFTGNAINGWRFVQKITGDSAGDAFGISITLNGEGNIIVMGGPNDDDGGLNAGAINIYTGNSIAGWTLKQKISGNIPHGRFGDSVSTNNDGSIIIVGASLYPNEINNITGGATFIYTGNDLIGWDLMQKFYGDSSGDQFGNSVAISKNSNTIVIGSWFDDDDNIINVGSATIYSNNFIVNNLNEYNIFLNGQKLTSEIHFYKNINYDFSPLFTILGNNISGKLTFVPKNYNQVITGSRNLYNMNNFYTNFSQVYKNGIRQRLNFDYIENGSFTLNNGTAILDIKNNSIYNNDRLFN